MPEPHDIQSHLAAIVRRRDFDRYLSILLSPREKKPALMALAAFGCELSHAAHSASEPALADIRFQWWRDALGAMEEDLNVRTGNPVADSLMQTIKDHHLPRMLIDDLIGAHEKFTRETMSEPLELAEWEQGWQERAAPIYELSVLVLGGDQGAGLKRAAASAAIACGASKNIRLDSGILKNCAETHRTICVGALQDLPAGISPAFLPVSLIGLNLEERADDSRGGRNAEAAENPQRRLRRLWTLWRAHRRKRID